jgi:hypothetical protein
MEALEILLGLLLIAAVLWDVFQSVVVPRPSAGRFRIARNLVRVTWRAARGIALRMSNPRRRDGILGVYAPALVLVLLAIWVIGLLLGYGLLFHAMRDQLRPQPATFAEAVYAAGTALFTIGFGDFVPVGTTARVLSLVAAGTGLGIVALVITFLFSLYGAFQRREVQVVTLDSRAGAPPSGVAILETYARLGLVDELPDLFAKWELWAAEVLESHVAYPILGFFRSSHDNESWVGSIGAVLDAATLVVTTVEGVPRGHAQLVASMGEHLVEDVSSAFGFQNEPGAGIARLEFDEARQRLAAAGYRLSEADPAWRSFSQRRSHYAARLNLLAELWVSPPSQWIGDRAPLGHHAEDAVELGRFGQPLTAPQPLASLSGAVDGSPTKSGGAKEAMAAPATPTAAGTSAPTRLGG